jgi:hypothetical protein
MYAGETFVMFNLWQDGFIDPIHMRERNMAMYRFCVLLITMLATASGLWAAQPTIV